MAKEIDADRFYMELGDIFDEITLAARIGIAEGVSTGLRVGVSAWREDARKSIGKHTYRRSGEVITSGAYAGSIRSHMLRKNEDNLLGEIGSKKLAGLSHLLENGHERVGGGPRVEGVLHIYDEVMPRTYEAAVNAAMVALNRELE